MASFAVVLDANVLIPASLRDILLSLANANLYRVHWSEEILEETRRTLLSRIGLTAGQADYLLKTIAVAFEDAMVEDYSAIASSLTNDPKDRHVLAAAIKCHASTIVTENLKDFPASACKPWEIEAQSPDEFLVHQYFLAPEVVCETIHSQATRLYKPSMNVFEVLDSLELHAPEFCRLVRRHLEGD